MLEKSVTLLTSHADKLLLNNFDARNIQLISCAELTFHMEISLVKEDAKSAKKLKSTTRPTCQAEIFPENADDANIPLISVTFDTSHDANPSVESLKETVC